MKWLTWVQILKIHPVEFKSVKVYTDTWVLDKIK